MALVRSDSGELIKLNDPRFKRRRSGTKRTQVAFQDRSKGPAAKKGVVFRRPKSSSAGRRRSISVRSACRRTPLRVWVGLLEVGTVLEREVEK